MAHTYEERERERERERVRKNWGQGKLEPRAQFALSKKVLMRSFSFVREREIGFAFLMKSFVLFFRGTADRNFLFSLLHIIHHLGREHYQKVLVVLLPLRVPVDCPCSAGKNWYLFFLVVVVILYLLLKGNILLPRSSFWSLAKKPWEKEEEEKKGRSIVLATTSWMCVCACVRAEWNLGKKKVIGILFLSFSFLFLSLFCQREKNPTKKSGFVTDDDPDSDFLFLRSRSDRTGRREKNKFAVFCSGIKKRFGPETSWS